MYRSDNMGKKFAKGIGFLFLMVGFIFLAGFVVMSLWNWLMPMLFGIKTVTFMQALGLLLLSKILFGNFGGKNHSKHRSNWKQRMQMKWESMTDEEKERFKSKYEGHWCGRNWSKDSTPSDQNSIEA